MPKRSRDPASSAPSASASTSNSQNPRQRKRTRVESSSKDASGSVKKVVKPFKETVAPPPKQQGKDKVAMVVSQPKKRKAIPGQLRRLAVPRPSALKKQKNSNTSGSTKPDVNRRGNKINNGMGTGGYAVAPDFLDDIGVPAKEPTAAAEKGKGKEQDHDAEVPSTSGAELWVTRKTSYPAYLKSGVAAFVDKGHNTLILRALGAAIPVCLSLALAIRDALPGGESGTTLDVRTGSVDVNDEIVPNDDSEGEDLDIQYQVRTKSSVECTISLKKKVRDRFLVKATGVRSGGKQMGVRPGRGGRSSHRPIRGPSSGRSRGRGR